jgi:hypothetical protein
LFFHSLTSKKMAADLWITLASYPPVLSLNNSNYRIIWQQVRL